MGGPVKAIGGSNIYILIFRVYKMVKNWHKCIIEDTIIKIINLVKIQILSK